MQLILLTIDTINMYQYVSEETHQFFLGVFTSGKYLEKSRVPK